LQSIVVDAGPLIAMFTRSDRHHAAALEFLARSEGAALITNLIVVGEVAAVLGQHNDFVACLDWIVENVEIDSNAGIDLPKAISILQKYEDLPADLADASLVAMCERRGTNLVASVDNDFDVYRLPKNRKMHNVFFAAT
jgi:predicted nucleic acid-binding protein